MDTTYTILADLPRLVALAISVTAALIAVGAYLRRRPSEFANVQPPPAAPRAEGIVYRDAPTVRVVDSQRVDRLRKAVRLVELKITFQETLLKCVNYSWGKPVTKFFAGESVHRN